MGLYFSATALWLYVRRAVHKGSCPRIVLLANRLNEMICRCERRLTGVRV